MDFPVQIVFDVRRRRPGCAILQAMGGTIRAFELHFPSETWLTHPTDDMKLYRVDTQAQLDKLIAMSLEAVRR